ncbi:MAG: potassium/proton antiporter [Sneathiellaceae bacterium]
MTDSLDHLILLGSALVLLSIFAGMVSSRVGAPLLLVFLGLGMLAGEEGPGGIDFQDFDLVYGIGSVALAVILFDGGMRTPRANFRLAMWPAMTLASVGVFLTTGIVAAVAWGLFGFGIVESVLIGAVISSTDAAAVFFLLNVSGMELQKRVNATLEVESGLNDPMAVFLTITCVSLLLQPFDGDWLTIGTGFVADLAGGAVIGIAGGQAIVWLVNRLEIASGLYAILAVAAALLTFAAAQSVGASGFLAIYLAGLIVGNRRHRGRQLVGRFMDGMAWLMQITMFLLLGLLVTPTRLLDDLWSAVAIAAVLMFLARPLAVGACLLPFRFSGREIAFISWVGLRGAVPIFLATVPVLAQLPGAESYFSLAFVVVLLSLLVQGWTIAPVGRALDLELPPREDPVERQDLEIAQGIDRDIAGYRVGKDAIATGYPFREVPLPPRTRVIGVIRQGVVMDRGALQRLQEGDTVLALASPENLYLLDRLFAGRRVHGSAGVFGEFSFDAAVKVEAVAEIYDATVPERFRFMTLAAYIERRGRRHLVVGDRVMLDRIELVVEEMAEQRIVRVGVELDPRGAWLMRYQLVRRIVNALRRPAIRPGSRPPPSAGIAAPPPAGLEPPPDGRDGA